MEIHQELRGGWRSNCALMCCVDFFRAASRGGMPPTPSPRRAALACFIHHTGSQQGAVLFVFCSDSVWKHAAYHHWGCGLGDTGIYWVEVIGAAKHRAKHRIAPQQRITKPQMSIWPPSYKNLL